MTKEETKQYKHQYYLEHKEKYQEYMRNYKRKPLTIEQKMKQSEKHRRYYMKNREQLLAKAKVRNLEKKNELAAYQRAYREYHRHLILCS